mgnify:CR=1
MATGKSYNVGLVSTSQRPINSGFPEQFVEYDPNTDDAPAGLSVDEVFPIG